MAEILQLRRTDTNQELIDRLERLHMQAKSGRLQGVFMVCQVDTGEQKVLSCGSLAIDPDVLAALVVRATQEGVDAAEARAQKPDRDPLPRLLQSS